MADVNNPTAIRFANEKVRPMADALSAAYWSAKAILAEWNALNMSALIPNDSSPLIDGSAADGRPPITGAQATNIINRAAELVTDFEAASSAKLNTVLQVRVNGGSRL